MAQTDRFFVITGGPGAGKSTLLAALAARGLRVMPEAGRAIIQDQGEIGGRALPWADRAGFAQQMLGWELRSHREALAHPGLALFDRGLPDLAGYLALCGLPVPAEMRRAVALRRYNPLVFIAPPWRAIFTQDAERRQDFAEAVATWRAMRHAYTAAGYRLVGLPRAPVAARAAFVLARISPCAGW